MSEANTCPKCGSRLPAGTAPEMRPRCLMQRGIQSTVGDVLVTGSGGRREPPPTPDEISADFPQLEVLEILGQGGMGVVYKARQRALDRMVALKILSVDAEAVPAFAERFAREARALASLDHPNIVSIYDSGLAGDRYYLMMEYVDGTDLRAMIRAERIAPREALAMVSQVCDALQYAHDSGLVHRDIKPENILVDRKGQVKIADFGLAKLLDRPADAFALTGAHQAMGTPHYMAPEQIERPLEVDHRADIYSLGVVFYELLTGELPLGRFDAPSHKVEVDVRLDEVVLRTLEKDPPRRYQHASEVKTRIDDIASSKAARGRAARHGGHVGHGVQRDREQRNVALSVLVTVIAFVIGTILAANTADDGSAMLLVAGPWFLIALVGVCLLLVTFGRRLRRRGSGPVWPWALAAALVGATGLVFVLVAGSALLLGLRGSRAAEAEHARAVQAQVMAERYAEDPGAELPSGSEPHSKFCQSLDLVEFAVPPEEQLARFQDLARQTNLNEHEQVHLAEVIYSGESGQSMLDALLALIEYQHIAAGTDALLRQEAYRLDGSFARARLTKALDRETVENARLPVDINAGEHTARCERADLARRIAYSEEGMKMLDEVAQEPGLNEHEQVHVLDAMFRSPSVEKTARGILLLLEHQELAPGARTYLEANLSRLGQGASQERVAVVQALAEEG